MEKETAEMTLSQLGKDAVADMSEVSPQYKLKPPMPDADGKYRDIRGVIFNEKRNATDENGIPIKTPRGYFKLLPGVAEKEKAARLPAKKPVQRIIPPASRQISPVVAGSAVEESAKEIIPPANLDEVIGKKDDATAVTAENPGGQKKNTGIVTWIILAIAAIIGFASIGIGAREYFKR